MSWLSKHTTNWLICPPKLPRRDTFFKKLRGGLDLIIVSVTF